MFYEFQPSVQNILMKPLHAVRVLFAPYPRSKIRRAFGPGRVRSWAMTSDPLPSFIVNPLTPTVDLGGPQWSHQSPS